MTPKEKYVATVTEGENQKRRYDDAKEEIKKAAKEWLESLGHGTGFEFSAPHDDRRWRVGDSYMADRWHGIEPTVSTIALRKDGQPNNAVGVVRRSIVFVAIAEPWVAS